MKTAKVFAMAVIALSSLRLIAQQANATTQQNTSANGNAGVVSSSAGSGAGTGVSEMSATANGTQIGSASGPESASAEMSPVTGELVGKLDSKSAKAGDSVVVKTKEPVQTSDGTVIPKGSKLVGQVTVVQSHSQGSVNSAVAIHFDHAEIKGGHNVEIQSVIKSVAPAESEVASSGTDTFGTPMGGSTPTGGGSMSGSHPSSGGSAGAPVSSAPQSEGPAGTGAGSATGTAIEGTVVGKSGNDVIRTTAIPGVFLASSDTPGEASKMSGTLFAAKSDLHLDGGTKMVLEVSAAAGQ